MIVHSLDFSLTFPTFSETWMEEFFTVLLREMWIVFDR